jgi:hypothetical protein
MVAASAPIPASLSASVATGGRLLPSAQESPVVPAAGFGAAGWYSQLDPTLGRYVMYGGGGALAAGGLASCFAALARGTTLRYTLCGLMTGLGASVLGGAFASSLYYPGMAPTVKDPVGVPLISTPTFQTLTVAGGGIIAGAVVSGHLGEHLAWL